MNWKSFIPNGITLGNLLCGVLAIYFSSQDNLTLAAFLILAAAFLDFFDGFSARLLQVSGPLGTQLDSLADLVSFGLAPAFIAANLAGAFLNTSTHSELSFIPFLIPAFAAFRLAKFNIDEEQRESFKGLPTPSNALFWLSIPLILEFGNSSEYPDMWIYAFANSTIAIGIAAIAIGFLMIGNFPLMALKFKSFSWTENKWKYILILSGLILLIVFQLAAIPIILLLYLIISTIYFYKN